MDYTSHKQTLGQIEHFSDIINVSTFLHLMQTQPLASLRSNVHLIKYMFMFCLLYD